MNSAREDFRAAVPLLSPAVLMFRRGSADRHARSAVPEKDKQPRKFSLFGRAAEASADGAQKLKRSMSLRSPYMGHDMVCNMFFSQAQAVAFFQVAFLLFVLLLPLCSDAAE